MKDIKFFDPHLRQYIEGKDRQVVQERMKHTGLEYLFPQAQLSIATLDERTTPKELQENHPERDRMLLASGKRFVFTDPQTVEGLAGTLPGKVNPVAYGSLLLKECSAKNEQLRVRIVSANSDPYEVALAAQTWDSFKTSGELLVDVDPTNYLAMGYERQAIPQLLLPKSAMPELDSKVLHSLTPADIAEKFDINVRKIELAPHNFVRSMRVLVVDSKTGASSSTINPETGERELGFHNIDRDFARSITGDGHMTISNELAASKFGTDSRTLIQLRLIAKNQDANEISPFSDAKVGKGVAVAADLSATGFDLVVDESIHKGAGKIPPGVYNVDVWMGEIDRSKENGKQSVAALIPLFPELLEDVIPIIEPAVANLSAIQNDPIAVARSFCENFEVRQARLKKSQGEIDPESNQVIHLLPTEKYDVIKQSLETGNTALLQSGICAPVLIDYLRTSYLELALGSHEDLKFNRSMIAPSKELQDNEISIPSLPEGTKVIYGRAPVIGKNGIHIGTVKHTEKAKEAIANGLPYNYVETNDSSMSLTPEQQSAVVDMGADWDGDHIFWDEASSWKNLALGVEKHQADRDMDNIKLSKSEFAEDVSIEEAALHAENAPVGVIANTLTKTHSQISAIDMLQDPEGIATDLDRAKFASQIRDGLHDFQKFADKKEEPLLLHPAALEGEALVWFDQLERCTNARVSAILDAPRFNLMTEIPTSDENRYVMAKAIKASMYGYSQNNDDVWFSTPEFGTLDEKQQESFQDLSQRSVGISKAIQQINKIWIEEPTDGVYDTANVDRVLASYQAVQKGGVSLILDTEKALLRDMVVIASDQSQRAVSMKKSATAAEAPVVQRLNKFLPAQTPMMKEKKNGIVYTDSELTIDGITPQEVIASRVNSYFNKSEIKVSPAVCFTSLFDKTYTPEILGRVSQQQLAFDSDWNHAIRLSAKSKSEEGCVLNITDNLGRNIEITNLCKFSNDLTYNPQELAGLKWKIEENWQETEHGMKSYIPTEHKYVIMAQTSIVVEPSGLWDEVEISDVYNQAPPRFTEVMGTVCEFSRRDYEITTDEVGMIRSFTTAELASAQPDLSAQYFEKARDTALAFRTTLIEEGADLSVYAAALWHESTNRKGGVSVDSNEYSAYKNGMSSSICYFFPDQLKAQIDLKPLNIHRVSLMEGVKDLAVGDALHFKGERINSADGVQRVIGLSSDGGNKFAAIGTPWDNAIPMDMSGRSLSGKIVAAGNSQMLLKVPGIDEPLVFGAVDKNFLKDQPWVDGAANISFEPVSTPEFSLHLDGRSIGKVDKDGTALIQKYGLDTQSLSVTITQKTQGKQAGVSISVAATVEHPAVTFDLQGKGLFNLDGKGNSIDRQVKISPKETHSLGVFMTGEDGIKHQIGEFTTHNTATSAMVNRTTHNTSAKSIKELARAGYIEWEGLSVSQRNGTVLVQGEKPNRSFPPTVLKIPGEVQLLNSNQNFAVELDRDIEAQRLPVVQQEFAGNFIGRVYGDIAPIIAFDSTIGVLPKIKMPVVPLEDVIPPLPQQSKSDLEQRIDQANQQWAKDSPPEEILKPATLDLIAQMKARMRMQVPEIVEQEVSADRVTNDTVENINKVVLEQELQQKPLKVMISGSSSIKTLPPEAIERINTIMQLKAEILVGDAPGIDTEVQKYLKSAAYERVTVYHVDQIPRNNVGFPNQGGYSTDIQRDKAMGDSADRGLAVWDGQSKGTAANIERVPTRVVAVSPVITKEEEPAVSPVSQKVGAAVVKKIDRGGR